MTIPQSNTLLTFAIVAGLLSLPMNWFTFNTLETVASNVEYWQYYNPTLQLHSTVYVTGLTGKVPHPIEIPAWFIIAIAISASAMQFMAQSTRFAVPKSVAWITTIIGVAWILFLPMRPGSQHVSISIGFWLAVFCTCGPLACLWFTRPVRPTRTLSQKPVTLEIALPCL